MKHILLAFVLLAMVTMALPAQDQSGFTVRVYKRMVPMPGEDPGIHYALAFHTDDPTITGISGEAACVHADGTREAQISVSAPVSLGGKAWKFITCAQPSKIAYAVSEIRGTGRQLRGLQEPENR